MPFRDTEWRLLSELSGQGLKPEAPQLKRKDISQQNIWGKVKRVGWEISAPNEKRLFTKF